MLMPCLARSIPFSNGSGVLSREDRPRNAFEALRLALFQPLQSLVVEPLYIDLYAGRSRGLFSTSGAFLRGGDAAALQTLIFSVWLPQSHRKAKPSFLHVLQILLSISTLMMPVALTVLCLAASCIERDFSRLTGGK